MLPFHLVQSANNEFLKTHRVLKGWANVCYHKNQVFLWFTIHSQLKLKKIGTRLATKFNKVSWWNLWIWDPRNFHNSFFVKNDYLNLNFSKHSKSALFKSETKNLLKKNASQLKIAWQLSKQEEKSKTLRKKKKNKKWEKVKQQLFYFYFFT